MLPSFFKHLFRPKLKSMLSFIQTKANAANFSKRESSSKSMFWVFRLKRGNAAHFSPQFYPNQCIKTGGNAAHVCPRFFHPNDVLLFRVQSKRKCCRVCSKNCFFPHRCCYLFGFRRGREMLPFFSIFFGVSSSKQGKMLPTFSYHFRPVSDSKQGGMLPISPKILHQNSQQAKRCPFFFQENSMQIEFKLWGSPKGGNAAHFSAGIFMQIGFAFCSRQEKMLPIFQDYLTQIDLLFWKGSKQEEMPPVLLCSFV